MYNITKIKTNADGDNDTKVLVIYTGGTLGMIYNKRLRGLAPFDFAQIPDNLPEMSRLEFEITVLTLTNLIDSANIKPKVWLELAEIIEDNYVHYDSFVILHGTDTMAFTASALSFLLQGLNKPVILTGAQLPIGVARTDAKENFITALEMAAAVENNEAKIKEVCIYFNSKLFRGNRSKKQESVQFDAFESENYPVLAEAGVDIEYNFSFLNKNIPFSEFKIHKKLNENVFILKLFPGIYELAVISIFEIKGLKGIVLETFGAGNAPTDQWFIDLLSTAITNEILFINVSQCNGGKVNQGHYVTSAKLKNLGVVNGNDITTEAAITKLMYVLSCNLKYEDAQKLLGNNICGEMY